MHTNFEVRVVLLFRNVIYGMNDGAETALFFASPESDRITGQILNINGGLSFPG